MEKKDILEAFKQAEIDYTKSKVKGCFCFYFLLDQDLNNSQVEGFLMPLWKKYATTPDRAFHFNNRQERLEAIRKVINELEKE
jgi:hypothetical protein